LALQAPNKPARPLDLNEECDDGRSDAKREREREREREGMGVEERKGARGEIFVSRSNTIVSDGPRVPRPFISTLEPPFPRPALHVLFGRDLALASAT
jgi:hypothetical protein